MQIRIFLFFLITAVVMLNGGCSIGEQPKSETASTGGNPVVEFKYPEWTYYDLAYLTDDLGYFKNSGIRPKYTGKVAAGQMIPSLLNGDLVFHPMSAPALFPVVILFSGLGELSKDIIIFWASLWPIFLNIISGVKNVD